jgi:hypothetical protein
MNNKLEMMCTEVVVTKFKAVTLHIPGRTELNDEKSTSWQIFDLRISIIQSGSAGISAAVFVCVILKRLI